MTRLSRASNLEPDWVDEVSAPHGFLELLSTLSFSSALISAQVGTGGEDPSGHVMLVGRTHSPQGPPFPLEGRLPLSKTVPSGQVMLVGFTPAPQGFLSP